MEGNMVKSLNPQNCINVVVDYFNANLVSFNLIKSSYYTGYWWLEYANNEQNLIIYFDGDIGGHFYVKLNIFKSQYHLWQYDRSVNQRSKSTEENILYQLKILDNFLKSL